MKDMPCMDHFAEVRLSEGRTIRKTFDTCRISRKVWRDELKRVMSMIEKMLLLQAG